MKRPVTVLLLVSAMMMTAGMLPAATAFGQESGYGAGWDINYSADIAAQKLLKSVVYVETRFDRPRNDDAYAVWGAFRGARPLMGLFGTGVIYKDSRYVITSPFLMEHAEYVRVVTWDGKSFSATIEGKNDPFKTAVLKVEWGSDYQPSPAAFGDSDQLKLGEPIAILGRSEEGLDFLSTVGVISAIRKELPTVDEPTEQYIQFDAPYYLPMMGGPLSDVDGTVIGIVYNTVTDFYGTNVNFAVPINDVIRAADSIIAGVAKRVWFGVERIALTEQIRALNRIPERIPFGMFITYVEPGSPADLAGLKAGDLMVSLDGNAIEQEFDYSAFFRRLYLGQVIEVEYWRFTAGVSDNPSVTQGDVFRTVVQILEYPEEE